VNICDKMIKAVHESQRLATSTQIHLAGAMKGTEVLSAGKLKWTQILPRISLAGAIAPVATPAMYATVRDEGIIQRRSVAMCPPTDRPTKSGLAFMRLPKPLPLRPKTDDDRDSTRT